MSQHLTITKVFLLSFLLALAVSTISLAQETSYSEIIRSYEVSILINKDASIDISEKIQYDFGANQRHGIFRDIPISYKARGGNFNLRISDVTVKDEAGAAYPFSKSKGFLNPDIRVKIGDPDAFVTGIKTYVINYKIRRAINYFSDHDELYWNAIGTQWQVPIENAKTTVLLPEEIEADALRVDGFVGPFGSTLRPSRITPISADSGAIEGIEFLQDSLASNEGMTIVVGLPPGTLHKPTFFETAADTARDNWVLLLPVLTFGFLLRLWYTRGRDPRGRGVVIAQFEAPDKLTPSEIGTILDEKVHNKDISADIINLAVKGYLKITRIEAEKLLGLFGKSHDYSLEKLKSERDLPNGFERKLMTSLFKRDLDSLTNQSLMKEGSESLVESGVSRETVRLSDLKDKFHKDLKEIRGLVYRAVVDKGYFPASPTKVKAIYAGIGAAVIGLGVLSGFVFGYLGIFSLVASGIMVLGFAPLMPAKTKKGAEARELVLGLKEYLRVAEKDRLKFHNAPEKNPKHFEELLPYAIALNVEDQWAAQFEDIYKEQPSWYYDPSGARFSSPAFASDLNSFTRSASTVLASSPSSAAGGGSGFSGGGSGGGGGGGGGGSW
jgi:hypothetical protein